MKQLRYIIIYVLTLLGVQSVVAQGDAPTITASISADTIMIGDRLTYTIEVEKDVMQLIDFPQFSFENRDNGEAVSNIEVVNDFAVDTVSQEGRRVRLRKRYELVIYDEGIINFGKPHVRYLDKNVIDTLSADKEWEVYVKTFPIDSLKVAFEQDKVRDLKPQKTLPFKFGEIAGYVAISAGVLLLMAGVVFLLVRYLHKRGKRITDLFKPAPAPPAHIVAIDALEKLHDEKLWQRNKHKLYYSGLSDILRTYIAGRFEVGAMEMTTDEIVEALRTIDIEQKSKMELLSVLRDADLVKFAKAQPEAEENEGAYNKAFYFVENTKPVERVEEQEDEPTKNNKEE